MVCEWQGDALADSVEWQFLLRAEMLAIYWLQFAAAPKKCE